MWPLHTYKNLKNMRASASHMGSFLFPRSVEHVSNKWIGTVGRRHESHSEKNVIDRKFWLTRRTKKLGTIKRGGIHFYSVSTEEHGRKKEVKKTLNINNPKHVDNSIHGGGSYQRSKTAGVVKLRWTRLSSGHLLGTKLLRSRSKTKNHLAGTKRNDTGCQDR